MTYSNLLQSKSLKNRKQQGIYYTPDDYCEALAKWAIRSKSDIILEPSFGGGGFLRASYECLILFESQNPAEQMRGYDTDIDAYNALKNQKYCSSENLFNKDFLDAVEDELRGKVDVILGNPPYIGWKDLTEKQKQTVLKICPDDYLPTRQANLWVFFCLKSLQLLNKGGRFAMVLPRSLIFSDYGKSFLNYFKTQFKKVRIIESSESCFKYCGAAERPIILMGEQHKMGICQTVDKHRVAGSSEISSKGNSRQSSCAHVTHHAEAQKVFSGAISLGDVFDVRIGIVTGDNDYFLFSEEKRKRCKIQHKFLLPIVAKSRDFKRLMYNSIDKNSSEDGRLVYMLDTRRFKNSKRVKDYLDSYPRQKIEENTTFSKATVWHQPTIGQTPSAFFSYMTNTGPRLVLNNAKVQCVNSIHRLYHKKGNQLEIKWCSLYIFSVYGRLASELVGRTYASGLLKLEPSDVKKLPLFIPKSSEFMTARFNKAWRKINHLLKNNKCQQAYDVCNDYVHNVLSGMNEDIPTIIELHNLTRKLSSIRTLRD